MMDFKLNLTQEQKLIMTTEMQLSLKLLQMSSIDLKEYIEKQLEENPVLEIKETDSNIKENDLNSKKENEYNNNSVRDKEDEVSPLNFVSQKKSLKEFLNEQLGELSLKKNERSICEYIIWNLDEKGYFTEDLNLIANEKKITVESLNNALKIVQGLEPVGIGATNLQECLLIQIENRGILDKNIKIIIENYLNYIAENKYINLSKELKISVNEAQNYGDIIKTLEPKPSRGFYTGEIEKYIFPDAYIKIINDENIIIINDEVIPHLTINNLFENIINDNKDEKTLEYAKNKMKDAMFLIKSIDYRNNTLFKLLEKLLEIQKDYFEKGNEYLKPMTLKEMAEKMGMHESTISRTIRDKYVYTDRGLIRIKDLFTVGLPSNVEENVSNTNIKNVIKKLILGEDKNNPLSDQAICEKIKLMNIEISRRTVAKYREEMNIVNSSKRKRF